MCVGGVVGRYFQSGLLLETLGLRKGFDERHGIPCSRPMWWAAVPCLFIWGADKGFKFHPQFIEREMEKNAGCRCS